MRATCRYSVVMGSGGFWRARPSTSAASGRRACASCRDPPSACGPAPPARTAGRARPSAGRSGRGCRRRGRPGGGACPAPGGAGAGGTVPGRAAGRLRAARRAGPCRRPCWYRGRRRHLPPKSMRHIIPKITAGGTDWRPAPGRLPTDPVGCPGHAGRAMGHAMREYVGRADHSGVRELVAEDAIPGPVAPRARPGMGLGPRRPSSGRSSTRTPPRRSAASSRPAARTPPAACS